MKKTEDVDGVKEKKEKPIECLLRGSIVSGTGTLYFKDKHSQLKELVGKIIITKESIYKNSYVEVESGGKHYVMPIGSLGSIRWDKEPKATT